MGHNLTPISLTYILYIKSWKIKEFSLVTCGLQVCTLIVSYYEWYTEVSLNMRDALIMPFI